MAAEHGSVVEVGEVVEEVQFALSEGFARAVRKRRRNRRDSTRTGRKKPGRHAIHVDLCVERPPPGTTQWTWGWWVIAWPQVCSTAVTPISAPSYLGLAAMACSVSAEIRISSAYMTALF